MAGSNDGTLQNGRLAAAPLNLTAADVSEMQVLAYLLRVIATLPDFDVDPVPRLQTMAHFFELETEQAQRIYKYARQRALDANRLAQVRKGIVVVDTGEVDMVRESMGLGGKR